MKPILRGRIILVSLILLFALPVVIAKAILSNQWYQSGVTNSGKLIEPLASFESMGVDNPLYKQSWQLGYLVPKSCDQFCVQQLHLLGQSHLALGKYQARVAPVLMLAPDSDPNVQARYDFQSIKVNEEFEKRIHGFEFVIVDPLGQLVMRYPKVSSEKGLVVQSKGLLADLRKLLKLSRVG